MEPRSDWPRTRHALRRRGAWLALLLVWLSAAASAQTSNGQAPAAQAPATEPPGATPVERGAYLFRAGGCASCHTDAKGGGAPLAGGRPLATPFGTFYSPNITPDPEHGIGGWSVEDLVRALKEGVAPDGSHYFPVFPFTSYAGMTEADARDLAAYLLAQPPVATADKPHEIAFPFNQRWLQSGWKLLFFDEATFVPDPAQSEDWNRGAYLVRHLGHCGECHSPRTVLGAVDGSRALAGNPEGPDGDKVPNITPSPEGIGDWSEEEIVELLESGFDPDFDVVGGLMGEVVNESTSHLTEADRRAIAVYLKSLTPLPSAD